MQRLAERLQRGLVEGFAFRRVRVDRAGDVLESPAHLERKRERRREFGNARADRVNESLVFAASGET